MTPQRKPRATVSALDRMRARTNWNAKPRPTGFSPLYTASLGEALRIADNAAFKILMLIWDRALGRIVAKGKPPLEVTEPMAVSEIAELVHCDERTVQRELNGLVERKVIARKRVKNGLFEFAPLYKTWASLPNYAARPVSEPEPEPDDEPIEDDPAPAAKQKTHIIETPVYVRAGKKSKRFEVPCGVAAFECQVKGTVDAECSAVVQDGVLRVILEGKWDGQSVRTDSLKAKGIEEKQRQGCRISPNEPTGKGTKGERRTSGEQPKVSHPRADELSSLFDPFLLKSCGKSLSGDPAMLLAACEAIQAVPHDYLVKCVVDRACRPISGGKAVVAICKEIAGNWGKVKDLPPGKRSLTDDDLKAMVAKDREIRIAKERELAAQRRQRRVS